MATRVLVVANETHGGPALVEAIKARHAAGDAEFVVIAPQNRPHSGYVIYDEAVRDAARCRVEATLAAMREHEIHGTGDVMDPDPYTATLDAVREHGVEEIIISTHPETRSGWLRRDLIERIQDATGLPVEHVVVDLTAHAEDGKQHTLVVANQTARGEPLFEELRRRAEESPHRFTVIVPQDGGHGHHAEQARARLQALLDRLREEGIEAAGGIGDPDPYAAIMNALQFHRIDEIVIATLPRMRSRWMRADLVGRVQKTTDCPVDHIVVDVAVAEDVQPGAKAA
jgi:hypothetical protein